MLQRGKDMQIVDLCEFAKSIEVLGEKGKFKFPLKFKIRKHLIEFWYETNLGYEPKPIVLQRFIPLNEMTLTSFGLIQTEASKSLNQGYFQFTNTTPELILFVLSYFERFWKVPKIKWKFRVIYYKSRLNENIEDIIKDFWSNFLRINKDEITVYKSSKILRDSAENGSMYIVLHNKIFKTMVLEFLEKIVKPLVENNSKISGYYLRGILSGDGYLNTYKNIVNHIGISFNPNSNEFKHYKKVLTVLNIRALYLKKTIQISHWENFFRLLSLTDFQPFIQKDKNSRFLKLLKNNIKTLLRLYKLAQYGKISTKLYSKLFNVSPRGSRKNLKRMVKLGLLERFKISRSHFYRLTPKGQKTLTVIKYLIERGD